MHFLKQKENAKTTSTTTTTVTPRTSYLLLKPFLDFSCTAQTATARLLTNLKRQDHVTPLLVFTTALHLADAGNVTQMMLTKKGPLSEIVYISKRHKESISHIFEFPPIAACQF